MGLPETLCTLFRVSAIVNVVGVVVISKGYTDIEALERQQPSVFSFASLLLIQCWGAAYALIAPNFMQNAGMCWIFFVEKVRCMQA